MPTPEPPEEPEPLPSGLRRGRLPKFEPTQDELEEGLQAVEHLFEAAEQEPDEDDQDDTPVAAPRYMVMRADGTLVSAETDGPAATEFDAEAFSDQVLGFFEELDPEQQETAQAMPVLLLREDGTHELDFRAFAGILRQRLAGATGAAACQCIEETLRTLRVLDPGTGGSLEAYRVERHTAHAIYPAAGGLIADGANLLHPELPERSRRPALRDGQRHDLEHLPVLLLDLLEKLVVEQEHTVTAEPRPLVAALASGEHQATILEGLFTLKTLRRTFQGKRVTAVALLGGLALLFRRLSLASNVCDKTGLREMMRILAPTITGPE
jgi:hypothetical protein